MTQAKVVICFCKHPEPGMVKSRLSADLGPERAVEIYKIILENTLRNICMGTFEVVLYCYPNIDHLFLSYCRDEYNVSLQEQDGNDLGERMYNAISEQLGTNKQVALTGSDCLELNSNYINDAFLQLEAGNDIVLGPALDGGYALLAANKIDKSIFEDIAWSTSKVLLETKERIKKLQWKVNCMSQVRDIDTLNDYQYFSEHENFKHLF